MSHVWLLLLMLLWRMVHARHGVAVVVVQAKVGILLTLLTKELSQRKLAAHGGGRDSVW